MSHWKAGSKAAARRFALGVRPNFYKHPMFHRLSGKRPLSVFLPTGEQRGAEDVSVWSHGNRQLGMELWATLVTGRITSSATLARVRCYGDRAGKSSPGR